MIESENYAVRDQALARFLPREFLRGESTQLPTDQWQELLRGVRVALLDGAQDTSEFAYPRIQIRMITRLVRV